MDLFSLNRRPPLADRMRPRKLEEFIGQPHLVSPGKLLWRIIKADKLSNMIFSGPPGTGKTTLARVIAGNTRADFITLNAVLGGVKDIRDAVERATRNMDEQGKNTILFIDEVHRFNKAQQDSLLPHAESGRIIFIGATTENPYFEVNKALISRSRIFRLEPLSGEDLNRLVDSVLSDKERGYGDKPIVIESAARELLTSKASGDARSLLNAIELAVLSTEPESDGTIRIPLDAAEQSIQERAVLYDKDGDSHYDVISAFIKSVRGSDPDAALYWMAKMIKAGEDPRFIFRRMLILASEDIGLADPEAITTVVSLARAFDYVGMPEGRYHLSQACLYLSTAPKSNSTMGFFDALKSVEENSNDDVPNRLKDSNRDGEGFGHGKGYQYPHAFRDHWVPQNYLPEGLRSLSFYNPSDQGAEKQIRTKMERLAALKNSTGEFSESESEITDDTTLEHKSDFIARLFLGSEELSHEAAVLCLGDACAILSKDLCSKNRSIYVSISDKEKLLRFRQTSGQFIQGGWLEFYNENLEQLPEFDKIFCYGIEEARKYFGDNPSSRISDKVRIRIVVPMAGAGSRLSDKVFFGFGNLTQRLSEIEEEKARKSMDKFKAETAPFSQSGFITAEYRFTFKTELTPNFLDRKLFKNYSLPEDFRSDAEPHRLSVINRSQKVQWESAFCVLEK